MAKKKTAKPKANRTTHKREREPTHHREETSNPTSIFRLIAILAGVGFVLTAYLTLTRWLGTHPAYCTADSACDLVQSSRWSTLLTLPLSFWGMLFYAMLGVSTLRIQKSGRGWSLAWGLAAFGFLLSVYLTLVSIIEIEATCAYCLASGVVATVIFVCLTLTRPHTSAKFDWPSFALLRLGVIGFVLAVFHFHNTGLFDPAAGPEQPEMVAFVDHLKREGIVFYGAYWCPRCLAQKKLFGASIKRLPYVECAPNGREGLRAPVCQAKNVISYPTWIVKDKHYTGIMSLKELAGLSGYQGPLP